MPVAPHPDGILARDEAEVDNLAGQGYHKCRNQLCTFMVAPEVQEELYEQYGDREQPYQCPHCGLNQDLNKRPGAPGGSTNAGLSPTEMGDIAEDLVYAMGEIPGYGKILWWHKGGASGQSALDGAVAGWGVEVKAANWNTQKRRGVIRPKERMQKLRAVQNPEIWAKEMHDPLLDHALHSIGHMQGLLGVLVLMDFTDNTADIFARPMPHDPEHKSGGIITFSRFKATQVAEKVPFKTNLPDPRAEGFVPFHQREQQPSDDPFMNTFSKVALDYAGDAYPAQEPQAANDMGLPQKDLYSEDEKEYKFFYANGELHVSPDHGHDELRQHIGVEPDHSGPTAVGYVSVKGNEALWEVTGNVGLQAMVRILKDYTKSVGWKWGGLVDKEGQPINDDFAPKKTKYLVDEDTQEGIPFVVQGKTAYVADLDEEQREAIAAQGFKLAEYPGGTNMMDRLKNHDPAGEDYEQWNLGDMNKQEDQRTDHNREPNGMFKCPGCGQLFPRWREYIVHRHQEEFPDEEPIQDGKFPELNPDAVHPPHQTERQPNVFPLARVYQAAKEPKDMLTDAVPFIFDVKEDTIHVGHPGARHSDIQGRFTPGGIVEGTYEPGGKVAIRSMTNMPYSVYHMVELWYYQHPEMKVTGVHLEDDAGGRTKLAATPHEDIGGFLAALAAADPAVHSASTALRKAGGKVYVVGGAVRDALLGKDPKDIDLMVQGIPPDDVRRVLEALPGRVDLTGRDFGVFRYKHAGHDVEIALPRRERSTGEGHQDFDVQADHTMSVEEDLMRRDFTANAMAVDLDHGELVDPFGGADDLANRKLKTVTPESFKEDPLRVVRALVAHSRHGLEPHPDTHSQMTQNADGLLHLPKERIQAELDKIFSSPDPAKAIRLAHHTGVLRHILPEVEAAWHFDQNNPHHNYPLGEHLLNVLEHTARLTDDPDVRLAGLLHDVGKPDSEWRDPITGTSHYYRGPEGEGDDHELVGAEKARERLRELKYPRARTERVATLIQHHMYPDFSSPRGARKFLHRVGEHADDLFVLREADRAGKGTDDYQATKTPVGRQRELVGNVRDAAEPTTQSNLAINGHDLIALGLQGPAIGEMLRSLTEKVIENPELNTRDQLLALARS